MGVTKQPFSPLAPLSNHAHKHDWMVFLDSGCCMPLDHESTWVNIVGPQPSNCVAKSDRAASQRSPTNTNGFTSQVPIASVFVASMALLSIIALYIFKPSVFAKATNYARMAARNMLVYALTDRKAAPGIFQEGKARKSSTEGKKLNAPMPRRAG